MRFSGLLLVLLLGCTSSITSTTPLGCSAYWDRYSFPLVVSPDYSFSEYDLYYVYEAIEFWNSAVGEQVFVLAPNWFSNKKIKDAEGIELVYGNIPPRAGRHNKILGITILTQYKGVEGLLGRNKYGLVILTPDLPNFRLTYLRVIIHELGHALGLQHDTSTINSYMWPYQYKVKHSPKMISAYQLDVVRGMIRGDFKSITIFGAGACF